MKSLVWYCNEVKNLRLFPNEIVPPGFEKGRLKLPSRAGVVYVTNGLETKRIKKDLPIPEGWRLGQKPERVKQISALGKTHKMGSGTGRLWINDGVQNKYIKADTVPAGWIRGRLKTGKFNPEAMRTKSSGTLGKSLKREV